MNSTWQQWHRLRGPSTRTFLSVARNFSYLIGRKNGRARCSADGWERSLRRAGVTDSSGAAAAGFQTFAFSSLLRLKGISGSPTTQKGIQSRQTAVVR